MKFLKWTIRVLPFLYMAAIWIMSSLPDNAVIELPDRGVDRFLKESLHLVEFAILYLLLVLAALTTGRFTRGLNFALMGVAAMYGLLDEVHQSFVPYRSATVIDFVKDVFGILVAAHFVNYGYFGKQFPRIGRLLRRVEQAFQ
ncbi:VanZ family protein [Bacillus sp. T33-2]|uniref:VanZ family protein n=1 Tax=Bacillus sp. T33-2 TaxID=2054168 RepID=UPI000C75E8F4|nr:VanZ family protein [Bacillus sp. T33-2]PLR94492.1 hypothetical protein CVD19_17560 [Bacillus sp. T33-2]